MKRGGLLDVSIPILARGVGHFSTLGTHIRGRDGIPYNTEYCYVPVSAPNLRTGRDGIRYIPASFHAWVVSLVVSSQGIGKALLARPHSLFLSN